MFSFWFISVNNDFKQACENTHWDNFLPWILNHSIPSSHYLHDYHSVCRYVAELIHAVSYTKVNISCVAQKLINNAGFSLNESSLNCNKNLRQTLGCSCELFKSQCFIISLEEIIWFNSINPTFLANRGWVMSHQAEDQLWVVSGCQIGLDFGVDWIWAENQL